jgi:ParB/RepB/Spo0J family partition protein
MPHDAYELDHADPKSLRQNPNNIRKCRDAAEDRRLVESVQRLGVLQPPGVMLDDLVAWGNRRVWAAVEVGMARMPVIRLKKPLTETEFLLLQFAENDVRADLRDPEIYLACKEMRRLNPAWTNADLAERIHKDASMLTRIFSVDNLIPAAREAFLAGALGFSIAYEISKAASEKEQHELLAERLGGSSRSRLAHAARGRRSQGEPSVRMSRVRCRLESGVQVMVSGSDLSLDDVLEALADAARQARKVRDQGGDAKSFNALMKAKAGVNP